MTADVTADAPADLAADLVVVGGGPAGLVTAIHAARRGLRTVLFEQRPVPIDKACGEGLMPGGVRALRELGVAPRGREFRGITYLRGARHASADFAGAPGLGVRRTELHAALLDAAVASGVAIRAERVAALDQCPDAVAVNGVRARYAVAADGLHSPVRRMLGLDLPTARDERRWGQRAHFAARPWSDHVQVHWGEHAEAYVTPVSDDLVGVAVLSRVRTGLRQHLAAFPALRDRLPDAPVGPVRGAGPLRQRAAAVRAGRVLLVGDAAGYVDALTGEGLSIAFACAAAAVEAIAADDVSGYAGRYAALTEPYARLTDRLVRLTSHRAVRRQVVTAAWLAPPVFRAAVRRLAGE